VGAIAEAAVAALGNDGHAVFGTDGNGRSDTSGVGGTNDYGFVGGGLVARIDQKGGGVVADENGTCVERCPEGVDDFGAGERHQAQARCIVDGPRKVMLGK
jgi:hypothetical protein